MILTEPASWLCLSTGQEHPDTLLNRAGVLEMNMESLSASASFAAVGFSCWMHSASNTMPRERNPLN
jgi:hypothetical protein